MKETETQPNLVPVRLPAIEPVLQLVYSNLDEALRTLQGHTTASLLQGCLPLLLNELSSASLIARLGNETYPTLRDRYRTLSLLNLRYTVAIQQVLTALQEADIIVMVLKGVDVATTLYPHTDLRYFDDVDLMLHPDDLPKAIAVLERLGYSYHQEYRFEAISKQRAGFVYAQATEVGYLVFELHTAPHANEFGVRFDTRALWARSRSVSLYGVEVAAMELEDLLLYLCWHYRSHTFERLIWLYDIALLLLTHGERLDWSALSKRAKQQGIHTTLSLLLHWCHQLWQVPLPAAAQQYAVMPRLLSHLLTLLFGNDTTRMLRRSATSQRKLLQYILVDTPWKLILVLLRALFPSPTHLGRRYMESSRLPVRLFWLYYFIHPVLAIREAFYALQRRI